MNLDIKYLIKFLDENKENKKGLRIYDFLTERFNGHYSYDSYILNTKELVLLDKNTEVFKTELHRISEFYGNRMDVHFKDWFY